MELYKDYSGLNFFDIDAYNILHNRKKIRIFPLLNSNILDNSVLKAVQGKEYQSYLFQVNKKNLSVFTNFYNHYRYNDKHWEGKNYFVELSNKNHDIKFFLTKNNLLPSEIEQFKMYSFLTYRYSEKDFSFFIKRELIEENIVNKREQLFKAEIDYTNYSIGTSLLFNSPKWKLFFEKRGSLASLNYSIKPFYYYEIYDTEFNINYKNKIYFEKESGYDWIESNQNNYYEAGYNNDYINIYARYIEKQINSNTNIEDKIIYGLKYSYKLEILSNLCFITEGDIFLENYFNDILVNSLLYEKYLFQNDLKLTLLLQYKFLTESMNLIGSDFYDAYFSVDLKGGRIFVKIKNLLNDTIHHYSINENDREIQFGFNLFLYN
ncbi:MAG: hypothetical protein FXF47_01070 [Candidatus Mcinerneyibacterium aminivorans]|uniref:Uncharacterized protein n=1 Tax=Candidatus Mcinerneyibacterium aminivorans TaxID=2703815 RepID=A0A5D0MLB8_9BACT|nr:MAG: hypothetical protein FXF47_01070 [Candidatus Mcinerneyibacterium aminivorans]